MLPGPGAAVTMRAVTPPLRTPSVRAFLEDDPVDLSAYAGLRREVRAFLDGYRKERGIEGWVGSWDNFDKDFSRALGARGWIGMAFPKKYGGGEKSVLERYVVLEELLAAAAPAAAHWIADRQSGPLILKFGTEDQRERLLPGIAKGELSFAIGMSEPNSGSDLAAARTRAVKADGGWIVNGTKIWSTNAHKADWMIALCRTGEPGADRHGGLTQFLVDLPNDGVEVNPIRNLAGEEHFNEVHFEDVFLPDDRLIGEEGGGWRQVMSELAFERSGPDRFFSTFRLLVETVRLLEGQDDAWTRDAAGRLVAHLWTVRRMSIRVAALLEKGEQPTLEASIVKDVGTAIEQEIPEIARQAIGALPRHKVSALYEKLLEFDVLHAPSFSIRGGTREILRGIIARGLGLR